MAVGSAASQQPRRWWQHSTYWLVALLAAQYALFQLLTGVQYGDAPRNLHWGLYTLEQPRFLLDVEDVYDRVDGFPPTPSALAPAGKATASSGPLHPWWGPLYPLLFAGVWWLSRSYLLLQLVVPLAAGALVLLTYTRARHYFGQPTALLGTTLLALFPIYREHAVQAYVEPLSALLLSAALWAFLARRTGLTVLFGTLTVLGKIDLILLYYGTLVLSTLLGWRDPAQRVPWRHLLLSLALPALVLLPWLYLTYVVVQRPTTVSGGPQLQIFLILAPMMLEQFFIIPWYGALLTFAALGAGFVLALRRQRSAPAAVYRLFGAWALLGALVLLVYSATPGASNNPRVIIPAVPPLVLLAANGITQMRPRWRMRLSFYLLALFIAINSVTIYFQVLQARRYNAALPAWETLRHQPRGYVLTEYYWHAVLYAQQPATWFEGDPVFQEHILHNPEHFRRYTTEHGIRYVVLPASEPVTGPPLVSPAVRRYLEQTFVKRQAGSFVIYTLESPGATGQQLQARPVHASGRP